MLIPSVGNGPEGSRHPGVTSMERHMAHVHPPYSGNNISHLLENSLRCLHHWGSCLGMRAHTQTHVHTHAWTHTHACIHTHPSPWWRCGTCDGPTIDDYSPGNSDYSEGPLRVLFRIDLCMLRQRSFLSGKLAGSKSEIANCYIPPPERVTEGSCKLEGNKARHIEV